MIESQSKFKWMGIAKRLLRESLGLFVRSKGFLRDLGLLVRCGKLSDISDKVSLHLEEEHFSLITVRIGYQLILNKIQDVLANASEFSFNGLFVVLDFLDIFIIAFDVFFLLD